MPLIQYKDINLGPKKLAVIAQANTIITEYAGQGFDLTLRQLYYQFVSRDLIANTQQEYKRLGDVINDGRLAGLIDWDSIVDRTRNLRSLATWDNPSSIVRACAEQFKVDRWENQRNRVEVWIEKDALVGVIQGVCDELRVPYFSCRGYTSQSEMWSASQRLIEHARNGQTPVILHLGDHDPSGIDMSRDIEDRIALFMGHEGLDPCEVRRLALNEDQVRRYNPPPNPAKVTDSRAKGYIKKFGHESWELDALDPATIAALIRDELDELIDVDSWQESGIEEKAHRVSLSAVAKRYADVCSFLTGVDHGPNE